MYLFFLGLANIPGQGDPELRRGDQHGVRLHPAARHRPQAEPGRPPGQARRRLQRQEVQDLHSQRSHRQVSVQLQGEQCTAFI